MTPLLTHRIACTPDDLRLIDSLARRIWPATYGDILSPEQIHYMLSWMYSLETLQAEIAQGIRFFLFFDEHDTPIAFTSFGPSPTPHEAMIHKVYLLPECHGKGLGQHLLSTTLDAIRDAGFSSAILHVNRFNQRAIKAYTRAGFSTRRAVVTDIGKGYIMDDYELEITLPRA